MPEFLGSKTSQTFQVGIFNLPFSWHGSGPIGKAPFIGFLVGRKIDAYEAVKVIEALLEKKMTNKSYWILASSPSMSQEF